MTIRDVILKMSLDEKLVINGEDFYYFHTTPDELTNDPDKSEYLNREVSTIRFSHIFNAIVLEI